MDSCCCAPAPGSASHAVMISDGKDVRDTVFDRRLIRSSRVAIARISGRPATLMFVVATMVIWAVTGPLLGFGDTWQSAIKAGTTLVTFLMVQFKPRETGYTLADG